MSIILLRWNADRSIDVQAYDTLRQRRDITVPGTIFRLINFDLDPNNWVPLANAALIAWNPIVASFIGFFVVESTRVNRNDPLECVTVLERVGVLRAKGDYDGRR